MMNVDLYTRFSYFKTDTALQCGKNEECMN